MAEFKQNHPIERWDDFVIGKRTDRLALSSAHKRDRTETPRRFRRGHPRRQVCVLVFVWGRVGGEVAGGVEEVLVMCRPERSEGSPPLVVE